MIACGIVGAIISGLYVDKTRRFTPVVKVTFTMAALFGIVFVVVSINKMRSHLFTMQPLNNLDLLNTHDHSFKGHQIMWYIVIKQGQ